MYKQVKDYDNYIIYDDGNIKNTITNQFLKGSIGENGYKYYRLSKDSQKKMFYAHRLVAETFLENEFNLPVVNHKDGDKLNNNLSNLEWASYSENLKHAYQNNLISPTRQREYYDKDLENEQWKVIPHYSYSISSCGRVRNDKTLLLLKPSLTCGYYKVRLSKEGKVIDQAIHNLVYCTFYNTIIPNGYVINHKDGNKLNNNLENLELVTLSDNVKKALYETKTNSNHKEVKQFDLNHNYIATYPSTREAAKILKLDASTISKVCRGKNKTHGGFIFEYSK